MRCWLAAPHKDVEAEIGDISIKLHSLGGSYSAADLRPKLSAEVGVPHGSIVSYCPTI